jgi:transposase-like protein
MLRIDNLIDDAKCYESVRQIRWPDGVRCVWCQSDQVRRRGLHQRQRERQRYHCKACGSDFDDLTNTIFAHHHQPLRKWILCLYLMGLNLSNEQIAQELDLDKDDVHKMTAQLRSGVATTSLHQLTGDSSTEPHKGADTERRQGRNSTRDSLRAASWTGLNVWSQTAANPDSAKSGAGGCEIAELRETASVEIRLMASCSNPAMPART